MSPSEFINKFKSKYLWSNLIAMAVVVILLGLGLEFGIDLYTHHGESIPVPNIIHKSFEDAEHILDDAGLEMEVTDTGYIKTLPPGAILEQSPASGERVKGGHVIYVTINSDHSPMVTIPDVIDNSSLREAMAKLTALGFKLGAPQFIPGEQDWVYGILVKGHHVVAGEKVSIEETLIIQVGNGKRDASDSVDYIDPAMGESDPMEVVSEGGEQQSAPASEQKPAATGSGKDEFEVVSDNGAKAGNAHAGGVKTNGGKTNGE